MKLNQDEHNGTEVATCECEKKTNSDSYVNEQCQELIDIIEEEMKKDWHEVTSHSTTQKKDSVEAEDSLSNGSKPGSLEEEKHEELEHDIKRQSVHKELKQKLRDMNWSKEKARSVLLGEQWFQGRTGVCC